MIRFEQGTENMSADATDSRNGDLHCVSLMLLMWWLTLLWMTLCGWVGPSGVGRAQASRWSLSGGEIKEHRPTGEDGGVLLTVLRA